MYTAKTDMETETANCKLQVDFLKLPSSPAHCWVHPKAGIIAGNPAQIMITMQQLLLQSSDVFSPLYQLSSTDGGLNWFDLQCSSGLGRLPEGKGEVGICDFTPGWHGKSGKLLGTGHTVRYLGEHLMPEPRARETAYAVFDAAKNTWSAWETVELPDAGKFFNAGAGCTQRVDLPNGDLLLPIYFHGGHSPYRSITVIRCAFDGEKLSYLEHGSTHTLPRARGFLEPSLCQFREQFYLTLRAGDGRGYVSTSSDGLEFSEPEHWRWDNGEELATGDTQQHWLEHRGKLFLVYTRVTEDNAHVFRHRAPLFLAQVDPDGPCLLRESEQILVPQRGARLGNFQVTKISDDESWVTVSEWMQPVGCSKYGSNNKIYLAKLR